MKQRVAYLDIAKGILILMVIFYHTSPFYEASVGYNEVMVRIFFAIKPWFESFFMPAFFFINGYCSNFNVGFSVFIKKMWLSIILPTILLNIITLIIFGGHIHIVDFPFYVLDKWFICALLISRILYYGIIRIPTAVIRYMLPFLLAILGVWLCRFHNDSYEVRQGFIALFFVFVGNVCAGFKISKSQDLFLSAVYVVTIVILLLIDARIPMMGRGTVMELEQFPLFLLLSLSGTGMVLGISKWIGHNRMLEYFGQNSLSGYLLHGSFLVFLNKCIVHFNLVPVSAFSSVLVLLGSFAAASLWCYALAKILNTKHFKFILGKF